MNNQHGNDYKPPYTLTARIVDLVERIGEELSRASRGQPLRLRWIRGC